LRNISCFLTQDQVRDRSKTVTRRVGWADALPGQLLRVVVKSQGLKRGESIEPLAIVELVSVRRERLNAIDGEDCRREGFPDLTAPEFVSMFCRHMKVTPDVEVTRLEWRYREDLIPTNP
jgi:hypothetical protein